MKFVVHKSYFRGRKCTKKDYEFVYKIVEKAYHKIYMDKILK